MKRLLLLALLLTAGIGFSQNLEKDTIQLPEVRINNTPPEKAKVVKTRFSSLCVNSDALFYDEMVTLVTSLPKDGYISSVTFSFNETPRNEFYNYKDTELLLVFYEVDASGKPGAAIGLPVPFTLKADFSGKMELMVPYGDAKNPGKFFVGLRRVKPRTVTDIDFEVHTLCALGKKHSMYKRGQRTNQQWYAGEDSHHPFKMTIKEIVLPTK
nr:hypothetical protein [uncultured Flavobacterium sp.]